MEMRGTNIALVFVTSLFLTVCSVEAQVFENLIVGGKHKCGYLPDGTTKIYVNNNGNYEAVPAATAIQEIATQLAGARKRLRQLKTIHRKLVDDQATASSLGILRQTITSLQEEGYQGLNKLGKSRRAKISLAKELIKFAEQRVSYFQLYITALEQCRDNTRDRTIRPVEHKVVSVGDGSQWYVKVLVLIPRPLSGALEGVEKVAWCVRSNASAFGSGDRGYMSTNPCDHFVVNRACPSLFDSSTKIGRFWTGQTYGGRPSDEVLAAKIAELEAQFSAGFSGRMQGDGVHTSDEAEADECNDF